MGVNVREHRQNLGRRKLFCPHCGLGQIQFSQKCRCMYCRRMVNMVDYMPTKEEIAEKCLAIQDGWTEGVRELRTNYPYQPVYADDITYHVTRR